MTTKERIAWIDNAKALGIFLVFLGHFIEQHGYAGNESILQIYRNIYTFHMPFFFLLSGFMFRKKQIAFGWLMIEKIRSRLVPVLFFITVALLLWMEPSWWGAPDSDSAHALEKTWLLLQGKPAINWPCWFLICLFAVEMIASELIPMLDTKFKLLLALPIMYCIGRLATEDLAVIAAHMGFIENWWFLQEAMMALFFYLCGHALAKYGRILLPDVRQLRSCLIVVWGIALLITSTYFLFEGQRAAVNMSGGAHGHRFWFLLGSLSGSVMLIHLSNLISTNRLIRYIGQNTLPLVGISGLFLSFFNPLLWQYIPENAPLLWLVPVCAGIAASSIVISLPAIWILNRTVPILVGK